MPILRSMQSVSDSVPDGVRPYLFHGLDLSIDRTGTQATCPCPFCMKEDKFSIEISTTKFKCWSCNESGNALRFIRSLHTMCVESTPPDFYEIVATDRQLTMSETVESWGVCRSIMSHHSWLVPGYDENGNLTQLYKRGYIDGSWILMPTPCLWPDGKVHALHLPYIDYDPTKPRPGIVICEGPWDGMALWEVCQSDELGEVDIIAVPGCNVWRDEWTQLCKGRIVTLLFDNDHVRMKGIRKHRPGYDGMERIARQLNGYATEIKYINWGVDGYDPLLPDGWDIRDALSSDSDRNSALSKLVEKVCAVPIEWTNGVDLSSNNGKPRGNDVEPEQCNNWNKCESAWKKALEWRRELGDVLSVMLAVVASTDQSGDNQLFLQVIGDPGSAKTRLCKGLLVSHHCKLLLHLKSFHSGYKIAGDGDKDCSLVSRINGLCLVTPEADALHSGSNAEQINSQVRQIFDGESGNTYGNSDIDRHYKGLRSPWIQAGTPALMDKDQSRLGDRFLRIRINQPTEEVKHSILLSALRNERQAVMEKSNGTSLSIIPPKLRKAYALTGGYVNWLRANVEERLLDIDMDEKAELRLLNMAILVADLRARPNMDHKKVETHHSKELPTRLISQFGRLALCLAVTLNRDSVDSEVLDIVRKVALDTAHGHTLNIVTWLCSPNPSTNGKFYQECGGLSEKVLMMWCSMTADKLLNYLLFLRKIDVVTLKKSSSGGLWSLTDRMYKLHLHVIGE